MRQRVRPDSLPRDSALIAGLPISALILSLGVIAIGAYVRGFSGFGASMIWATGLTLVMPPARAIPVILMLEVAASLHLLPKVWREVDRHTLAPLLLGAWVATPVGVWALASLPAEAMRIAISAVVLVAVVLLWRDFRLAETPGKGASVGVGAVSGLLNGATSAGGPPVILFYFATPLGAAVGRASIIAYFLGTDAVAAALAAGGGLIDGESLLLWLIFLPAMLAGASLGARGFFRTDPERFRQRALILLAMLAVAGLLRAVW